MSFTASELESIIEDDSDNVDGLYYVYSDGREDRLSYSDAWSEIGWGGGVIRLNGQEYSWKAYKDVGGEGQGDYAAVIFSVETPEGRRLFRKEGFYSSYDGTDWDGSFSEVEEYEKTVTDFRRVR